MWEICTIWIDSLSSRKSSIFFIYLNAFPTISHGAHFDFNFKRLWLHENVMRKFIEHSCQMAYQNHLFIFLLCRLENREIYSTSSASIARSKSPNIFHRKALDSNTSAVNKTNAGSGQKQQPQQQQRARTASMPGENRKVKINLQNSAINWKSLKKMFGEKSFHSSSLCPKVIIKWELMISVIVNISSKSSTSGWVRQTISCEWLIMALKCEKEWKQQIFISQFTLESHSSSVSHWAFAVMTDFTSWRDCRGSSLAHVVYVHKFKICAWCSISIFRKPVIDGSNSIRVKINLDEG